MVELNLFPGGRQFALIMSFDDGNYDDRLIGIFNRYGIRGTFHLNSDNMKNAGTYDQIGTRYAGHEVACHGRCHRTLNYLPTQEIWNEVFTDRLQLEAQTGYPVTGMSYANGGYNEEVMRILRSMGIAYARTVGSGGYMLPEDFLCWNPTCHYKDAETYADSFIRSIHGWIGYPKVLFIWGHGHELENHQHWDRMEALCEKLGNRKEVWYTTCMEMQRYVTAQRSLILSADSRTVVNPSAETVWFTSDGQACTVGPGETWHAAK